MPVAGGIVLLAFLRGSMMALHFGGGMSKYDLENYTEQDGAENMIGGTLEFPDGAEVKKIPGMDERVAGLL